LSGAFNSLRFGLLEEPRQRPCRQLALHHAYPCEPTLVVTRASARGLLHRAPSPLIADGPGELFIQLA
jgi:hypothetical protein